MSEFRLIVFLMCSKVFAKLNGSHGDGEKISDLPEVARPSTLYLGVYSLQGYMCMS